MKEWIQCRDCQEDFPAETIIFYDQEWLCKKCVEKRIREETEAEKEE